jgi:hypothetical protein
MNLKINNSICFIANYSKTYLFHEIAQSLMQAGGKVCWITVNLELYDFLCKEYGKEKVLLINRGNIDQPYSAK